MTLLASLSLAISATMGGGHDTPSAKELARLEGVWSFLLVEVDGAKQPAVPVDINRMIITKDGRYVVHQGKQITRGTLTVDPAKTPMHYTLVVGTGPGKGLVSKGICELEGETLKICLPVGDQDRPAKFATALGSKLILFVLKRESKDIVPALLDAARVEVAGTWQSETYALDGKKTAVEDLKTLKVSIDAAGNANLLREGTVIIASTLTLDPSKNPPQMDLEFTAGELKGQKSLGIYKIENDILTICRAAPSQARPTEFASNPGSGWTLMTYRREK